MTDALSSPFAPVLRKRKLQDRLALAGVSPEHHDKLASNVAGGLSFVASNTNSDDEYCSDSSSTEDEYESSPLDEESDSVRQVPNQKLLAASRASSNSHLRENSRKKYSCTYSSCSKSYTKPSRLTEHERSHTGQRPFKCRECEKSYLRENHLQAHSRTHLPASDRPFMCSFEIRGNFGNHTCDKRFWTKQHLDAHVKAVHEGVKPYSCEFQGCTEKFAKHHQVRAHFAAAHCSPGTKPFRCVHEGCTKSFSTTQKLRTHSKVHQSHRYACAFESCRAEVPGSSARAVQYFSTWSELQRHIRDDHPPSCLHPDCDGQTFTSQKALRTHMRAHEQEESLVSGGEGNMPTKKARRGGEIGRDWVCSIEGCDMAFKSKKALSNHVDITHNGLRTFKCPVSDCDLAFGYKHVMQRHLARKHPRRQTPEAPGKLSPEEKEVERSPDEPSLLDLLTGKHYNRPSTGTKKNIQRTIKCPWPGVAHSNADTLSPMEFTSPCEFIFSRAYDLRRHLLAEHGFEVEQGVLDALELRASGR